MALNNLPNYKLALVTGASSGLGKALAYLLAAKKIPLLLTARNSAHLEEVKAVTAKQVHTETLICDLARPDERRSLISLIEKKKPDLILNCAGFGLYGNTWDHPAKESLEMVEVNISALLEISIEAARRLKETGGTIVNIASAAAFFSYPTFAVYAATKGFVKQFSESLDAELKPYGIRVLCSCPGQIATDFRRRAAKNFPQKKTPFTMSEEAAAKHVWKQIEKQKTVYIFDWPYRLFIALSKLLPNRLLQRFLKKRIESRIA